jgi:hypothetical protein
MQAKYIYSNKLLSKNYSLESDRSIKDENLKNTKLTISSIIELLKIPGQVTSNNHIESLKNLDNIEKEINILQNFGLIFYSVIILFIIIVVSRFILKSTDNNIFLR